MAKHEKEYCSGCGLLREIARCGDDAFCEDCGDIVTCNGAGRMTGIREGLLRLRINALLSDIVRILREERK